MEAQLSKPIPAVRYALAALPNRFIERTNAGEPSFVAHVKSLGVATRANTLSAFPQRHAL
jgi:hypothetical protein